MRKSFDLHIQRKTIIIKCIASDKGDSKDNDKRHDCKYQ